MIPDDYILTDSGKFFFFDPLRDPGAISLPSIARALGKICRFTGQTSTFYSVADHSVVVAEIVLERTGSKGEALAALLHDAAEAFLGDVSSPLKRLLGEPYRELERLATAAIMSKFGVGSLYHVAKKEIHRADMIALATEKRDFMPFDPDPWPCLEGVEPLPDPTFANGPDAAAVGFVNLFHRLTS